MSKQEHQKPGRMRPTGIVQTEEPIYLYLKRKHKELGFEKLTGPFDVGYDFKGTYKGREVTIEVELSPSRFLDHKHDPKEVQVLVVVYPDNTPRRLLPETIIELDPMKVHRATYRTLRAEAARKQSRMEAYLRGPGAVEMLASAFRSLHELSTPHKPPETPLGPMVLEAASVKAAFEYVQAQKVRFGEWGLPATTLEAAVDWLMKGRSASGLSAADRWHVRKWAKRLRELYLHELAATGDFIVVTGTRTAPATRSASRTPAKRRARPIAGRQPQGGRGPRPAMAERNTKATEGG